MNRLCVLHLLSTCYFAKTSHVSPTMRALGAAEKAAWVVLNNVAPDPGIDHVYAVKTIGDVHACDGKCACMGAVDALSG